MARLGNAAALKLSQVLADIVAMEVFPELEAMYSERVIPIGKNDMRIRIDADLDLFCRSAHPNDFSSPETNWQIVRRIQILRIEDRHA